MKCRGFSDDAARGATLTELLVVLAVLGWVVVLGLAVVPGPTRTAVSRTPDIEAALRGLRPGDCAVWQGTRLRLLRRQQVLDEFDLPETVFWVEGRQDLCVGPDGAPVLPGGQTAPARMCICPRAPVAPTTGVCWTPLGGLVYRTAARPGEDDPGCVGPRPSLPERQPPPEEDKP